MHENIFITYLSSSNLPPLFGVDFLCQNQLTSPPSTYYSLHLYNKEASWCWLWTLFAAGEELKQLILVHFISDLSILTVSECRSVFIQTESVSAAVSGLVWAQRGFQNGHRVTYEKEWWYSIQYKIIIIIMTCTIWCLRLTANILNNYEICGPNEKHWLKVKQ